MGYGRPRGGYGGGNSYGRGNRGGDGKRKPNRAERAENAKRHIAVMKTAFAKEIEKTVADAVLYENGEAHDDFEEKWESGDIKRHDATRQRVVFASSTDALLALADEGATKIAVIDYASYTNPGGGYAKGSNAQEEALCADSTLYPCLCALEGRYHEPNRKATLGGLYTSRAMSLPCVVFARDGRQQEAEIVVIAAPNRRRALENGRSERECDSDLIRRCDAALEIAALSGADAVVAGAFGCGVFGNPPRMVARAFADWCAKHPGAFAEVLYAIPGGANLDAFADELDVSFWRTDRRSGKMTEPWDERGRDGGVKAKEIVAKPDETTLNATEGNDGAPSADGVQEDGNE